MTILTAVTLDDGASAPGLSALARLKLSRELATIKTDIAAVSAGPTAALKRLKLVARANQIRAQLGISSPDLKPVPKPEPAPAIEAPEIGELREVAAGQHDTMGLDALLSKIDKAARALHGASLLKDEAEDLAHAAITHWARLELQANG